MSLLVEFINFVETWVAFARYWVMRGLDVGIGPLSLTVGELVAVTAIGTGWTIFVVGLALNALYIFQLVLAYRALRRRKAARTERTAWSRFRDLTVPVSVLAPAFNEEQTIEESVRALVGLRYPEFEIVVVNDGSKDKTLEVF